MCSPNPKTSGAEPSLKETLGALFPCANLHLSALRTPGHSLLSSLRGAGQASCLAQKNEGKSIETQVHSLAPLIVNKSSISYRLLTQSMAWRRRKDRNENRGASCRWMILGHYVQSMCSQDPQESHRPELVRNGWWTTYPRAQHRGLL